MKIIRFHYFLFERDDNEFHFCKQQDEDKMI